MYSSGQCWKPCTQGYVGFGSQCFKDCPVGFTQAHTVCIKPLLARGDPVAPGFSACPQSMTDDGANCIDPVSCTYVLTPNKTNWALQCTGTNTIAITRAQRQTCPAGYKLLNNLCYPTCPTRYSEVGNECARDCPDSFKDVLTSTGLAGSNCAPPTLPRTLGSVPFGGLSTITSNPNKTTLISRFLANQTPVTSVNQFNTATIRQGFDLGSAGTDFLAFLEGFAIKNPDIFAFLIFIILLFVAIYLGPSIKNLFGGITSAIGGLGSGVGKAAAGAGQAIGDVEQAVGSVAKGVGSFAENVAVGTGKLIGAAETGLATVENTLSNSVATDSLNSYTQGLQQRSVALQNELNVLQRLQRQAAAPATT